MATNEENNEDKQDQQHEEELDYEIEQEGGQSAGVKQKEAGEVDDEREDDDPEDRRTKSGGDDRGQSDKDEDLTPEQKDKREKRRQERKLRKQRQEERDRRLEALEARNAELEARVSQTAQRITTGDYNRVTSALGSATSEMHEAQRLMQQAKEQENFAAYADAFEAFTEARARAARFNAIKVQYEQRGVGRDAGGSDQGGERRIERPDPETVRMASSWRQKNTWYDPSQRDGDSKIAAAIDAQLVEERYDPRTPAYWRELDKRIAKQLPHRANRDNADDIDDDIDDEPSPTSGSGRERAASGRKTVRVSRERIEALQELGIDVKDRKQMQPYLRQFAKWDKENPNLLKGQ